MGTKELATDEAIQAAMMELLEAKLDAFMGRADLSDSPPEDKVAIRAGFFLGVSAGMSIANTIHSPIQAEKKEQQFCYYEGCDQHRESGHLYCEGHIAEFAIDESDTDED